MNKGAVINVAERAMLNEASKGLTFRGAPLELTWDVVDWWSRAFADFDTYQLSVFLGVNRDRWTAEITAQSARTVPLVSRHSTDLYETLHVALRDLEVWEKKGGKL